MGQPSAPRGRRVRTPTLLQMEAVECGAAALGIVLRYHGKYVPLEELRGDCGVSRDGTKASNILQAARRHGLKARGLSAAPEQLLSFPLPVVVFWNFNHFVVVEGFGRGKVYLNDPATGPRAVCDEEFGGSFTGVVLVFEPGPDFRRGGARPGLLAPLRARLRGSEAGLLYVVLAGVLLALVGLLPPVFTRFFIDHCLATREWGWLGPLLAGLAITAVLRAALTWLQRRHLLLLETGLALAWAYRYFRHVLRLPVAFFTQRYGGEIASRVQINDRIARLLSGELAANLVNVLLAVSYLALMLSFDVPLALVGVAMAGLNLLALRAVARSRKDLNVRLLQEQGKLLGTSMAGLQGIETLKATGAESDFFAQLAGGLARLIAAGQQMAVSTVLLGSVPFVLAGLTTLVLLGVGGLRVQEGLMTVGTLVAFQGLMASFLDPVQQLLWLGGSLQEVEGQLGRLDDVLRHPTDPGLDREPAAPGAGAEAGTEAVPARLSGRLEVKDVSYGHNPLEPPLIENFCLAVAPGSRVALVGRSGSGKSTLARLLCGLYQPWSGEVLLDGRPWASLPRAVLTAGVALVDQDIHLVEGTVREALTLWDRSVPEGAVTGAARDACLHDDIAARPGGYDSRVEEAGNNFSGGQRQRLEIARALVNNPALLILDEATSALDAVTEKQIDDNLRRRGCTCVIVAHRLSTIRDCDEILVLDHGRVVERGTHESLLQAGGLYRELIQS